MSGNCPDPAPAAEPQDLPDETRLRRLVQVARERLPALAAIAVLATAGLVAFALSRITSEIRYADVLDALGRLGAREIALALLFTALSFGALALYDISALAFIRRKLPLQNVLFTSFVAYSIGNIVGFGALSGGAIRFRAYSRMGLAPGDIARIVAYVTLSFSLGLLLLCALSALAVAPEIAPVAGISPDWLRAGALAVLAGLGLLLLLTRGGRTLSVGPLRLTLPDTRTASQQFLISAVDMAASASVLYVLLPGLDMPWPLFFAVYAAAVGVGILSHVPAGLGAFEAIMIAGLGGSIGVEELLGGLVAYRLVYHIGPLILAVALLTASELRRAGETPLGVELRQIALRLAPNVLAAAALAVGTMLVVSGVTPAPNQTLDLLGQSLPLPIVEAAHFLSSILGLVLFVSARGLARRLDGAWLVAVLTSFGGLVLSVLKAVALVQAGVLAGFLLVLLFNRRVFDRPASLFRQMLGPQWLAAVGVLVVAATGILFFVYQDTQYSHELWWQFEISEEAPRSLRALLGVAIGAAALAVGSLLRPTHQRPEPARPEELARAISIVEHQDDADANLVRMGDKSILFSDSGESFLMYGHQGRSWIALGDPIGADSEFPELVWQFIEFAHASGGRPVFYQISPRLLPACADAGLRAFKLGERASVDLSTFSLAGRRAQTLRNALSRGQREGMVFALIPPEGVPAVLDELQAISDAWLAEHRAREKRFSLGAFEPAYVASQPVAVLRREGRILAFATVMTTATKAAATVDLMRFSPEAPPGTMDLLFVNLLETTRAEGYASFNLGMAPLSGLARRDLAPVWDQIGGALYEHGERFYNFKGVRAFKGKFRPDWEPRYLAAPGTGGAALALMDVTLLIGGGIKGVIGR